MRRATEFLTVVALLALVGCGGVQDAPSRAQTKRPAPSAADVAQLRTMAIEVPIKCGYVAIDGDVSELDRDVTELIDLNRRSDPDAPITIQAGAGATTLRGMTQSIAFDLSKTNAFGKPICAPSLGRRLARATGVELP